MMKSATELQFLFALVSFPIGIDFSVCLGWWLLKCKIVFPAFILRNVVVFMVRPMVPTRFKSRKLLEDQTVEYVNLKLRGLLLR